MRPDFAATACKDIEKWWEPEQSLIPDFITVPHGALLRLSKAVDGRKVVL